MIIAIDIDGCMTDDNRFRLEQYGKYLFERGLPEIDNPYAYERKCDFMSREEFGVMWEDLLFEYIDNVQPLLYVSEVTHRLHEDGHTIVIATGRHGSTWPNEYGDTVRQKTTDWLKKHDIYYDELFFSGFPKIDYIRKYHPDVFVEDSPHTIESAAKEITVFIFDNPYNAHMQLDNTVRVFSWYDIYRKITNGF